MFTSVFILGLGAKIGLVSNGPHTGSKGIVRYNSENLLTKHWPLWGPQGISIMLRTGHAVTW